MRLVFSLVLGFVLMCAIPVYGQGGVEVGEFASPFLPHDHWVHGAVRRLEIAGLAPKGFGGGKRPRTQREVALHFERAELLARSKAPELAGLAGAYRLRFMEEFGWAVDAVQFGVIPDRLQLVSGRIEVGYEEHRGRVATGVGYDPEDDWTGALPREDRRGQSNHLALALALPPYLALHLTPGHRASRWEFDEAHLVIGVGKWSFWGGRRILGFHQGRGGGIVVSDNQAFDGGGISLLEPISLPWLLEYLGPVRFDLFLTRIENGDRITDPWFGVARGTIEPHPRLELGFNRANIFGGKGNSPTTPRSVLQMILGIHAGEEGEYNNEVFSVELRYTPPLGSVPLSVYLEWGMDDSAGGWWYVPARVVGLELAAVPGLPEVALGIERTSFAEGCCGNTIWYRNWSLRGGWADGGRPLGHSLGGHGTEWLVHGQSDIFSARVRMRFQIFTRNRGYENLFAPEREGRSTGGRISLNGSVGHLFGISLQGMIEEGNDGWRESALRVGVQVRF